MSEPRDNSGAIFHNDRKEKDAHPDYKGDCMINGTAYWVSGWLKQGKTGKFMSLAFRQKEPSERPDMVGEAPF